MTARRLVTSEGGDLIIVAASRVVRRMLEITGTTPLLA